MKSEGALIRSSGKSVHAPKLARLATPSGRRREPSQHDTSSPYVSHGRTRRGGLQVKSALIAALAFGTMLLLPRAQAQPTPAPQCTPEEKKELESYARTIRKFKQVGADQMKLVCEAVEAGEAEASTTLKRASRKAQRVCKGCESYSQEMVRDRSSRRPRLQN